MKNYVICRHDPHNRAFYPYTDEGSFEARGTGKGEGLNLNIPFCGPDVLKNISIWKYKMFKLNVNH